MKPLRQRLEKAILALPAIDCHSHIDPRSPHAQTLGDLLGYHYYTELAHSAGMPAAAVDPARPERGRAAEMVRRLGTLDNTVQHGWLVEAARALFGFRGRRLTAANWEGLAASIARAADQRGRYRDVLRKSRLEKVFLTNQFDEDLEGIDPVFVPCLRADDLVFRLADAAVRRRVAEKTGIEIGGLKDLRKAVASLMEYFVGHGAASAAIGLAPRFVPDRPDEAAAERALAAALRGEAATAGGALALERFAFDLVAGACADRRKPFQLMIGACRGVYPAGVDGGRDLLSKEGTLMQYADLFRRYPQVDFTVSILSTTWAHELATFAWILPNVKPSGHWWYTNVPVHIEADLRARLEAVPKVKLIGYYSDMYKVEFGLPKFNMYRRLLAKVLAEDFVEEGRMTEDVALGTARLLLYENPKRIFGVA